jgi:hypothetical protein
MRMIILPLVVTGTALFALPQAQEILVKLGQDPRLLDWSYFSAAAIWLAVNAWYWSRFISSFLLVSPFNRLPLEQCGLPGSGGRPWFGGQAARIPFLIYHLPRLLGFSALLTIAAALAVASTLLPGVADNSKAASADGGQPHLSWSVGGTNLIIAGIGFGIAAFVLYGLLWNRRALVARFGIPIPAVPPKLTSIRDLPWVLSFSTGLSLVIFIFSCFFPVTTGATLGSAAILFLAATAWISFGTLLVYACQATGLPIIGGIAAIAFISSLFPDHGIFRDNHDVRSLASAPAEWTRPEERITPYFDKWAAKPATDKNAPVIIVATAGGGIRAAYWTATVLGELTDRSRRNRSPTGSVGRSVAFDEQLFAISAVSGGSLGAAVYRGLLLEDGKNCIDEESKQASGFARCGQAVLSGDFLGPTLAASLFPDLAQRLFPLGIFPDRAEAIEKSWEASWQRAMKSNRFEEDFLSESKGRLPALLLNGTSVGTGRRLITASFPLGIIRSDGTWAGLNPEIIDFIDRSGSTVRLSTAVDNSARFSWVGPAGTIRNHGDIVDRVVDGGYFENFGATTAIDLIDWLNKEHRLRPEYQNLIVILISSDPDLYVSSTSNCNSEPAPPAYSSERGGEVLTPVITLMRTREARGSYAAYELQHMVGEDHFFHFHFLKQTDIRDAPLGWTLSERAQKAIRETWEQCESYTTMRRLGAKLNWTVP